MHINQTGSFSQDTVPFQITNVLVLGMGAYAFGRENRAVRMLSHMKKLSPYFLISKYGDESVDRLLTEQNFKYKQAPFGYLGRAKPHWTLITLIQIPRLYYLIVRTYFQHKSRLILLLSTHPLLNALIPILFLKWFAGARIVFYSGDIPSKNHATQLLGQMVNFIADRVIVNSFAVKTGYTYVGVPEEKIELVYNGVDPEAFSRVDQVEARHYLNWPSKSVLIGYAGQFNERKGVWDFIRAAEIILKNEEMDCCFLLIGKPDGVNLCYQEVSHYLEKHKLTDRVILTGWIDDMATAYAALDIVVIPSSYEDPAPNISIEAMASAVPVIATRVGGTPELLADGETGLLVEKNCPEEIAQNIIRLSVNPNLRKMMGQAGHTRVAQFFNIHKNAALVEHIILDI